MSGTFCSDYWLFSFNISTVLLVFFSPSWCTSFFFVSSTPAITMFYFLWDSRRSKKKEKWSMRSLACQDLSPHCLNTVPGLPGSSQGECFAGKQSQSIYYEVYMRWILNLIMMGWWINGFRSRQYSAHFRCLCCNLSFSVWSCGSQSSCSCNPFFCEKLLLNVQYSTLKWDIFPWSWDFNLTLARSILNVGFGLFIFCFRTCLCFDWFSTRHHLKVWVWLR